MFLITFLPILIILILLIVAGFFLSKINIWRPKRTMLFSGVYFAIALISFVGIVMWSDDSNRIESDSVLKVQLAQDEKIREEIELRNYESLDESLLKFSKTFEVVGTDIELIRGEATFNTRIVIEWNDSPKNEIVVSYYETPMYYNRMNISEEIRPAHVELKNNELHVYDVVSQLNIQSLRMNLEMLGNLDYLGPKEIERFIGLRILHLNVPRHLNIIDNSGWGY